MNTMIDAKPRSWSRDKMVGSAHEVKTASEVEISCLLQNVDAHDLVAPLRESWVTTSDEKKNGRRAEEKRQAALDLQAQWTQCLEDRETLRSELKRGQEYLQKVKADLASLRGRLEDWATFERHCGRNPLLDYAQAIAANEQIQAFLPGWLKRREKDLQHLNRKLERYARENGLQHLL